MLTDGFFALLLLAHLTAAVFLILAWRTEDDDRYERFAKIAAVLGCAGGLITLVTNYIVLFGPDVYTASADFILLLLISTLAPAVILTGSVAVLFGRNAGVRILAIGLGLWGCTTLLGYLAIAIGAFD